MNITASLFYFFEALAALSALGLLVTRNVFYGALLVIVCLLSLAGIYILAFAEFVAITQILIYAGGILIVILFGIMLTSKIAGKPLIVQNGNSFAGILIASVIFVFLVYYFSETNFAPLQSPVHDTVKPIGLSLMTEFLLPFEIAGILLLIALIGAAVTATSTKMKSDVPD
jgi:NADH:ubiquinone oxidoreductase subunit 6 (subunit J)